MTEKTDAEKAAWLDGYLAAAETASSFQVRVGHEIDDPLNLGAQMVASLLKDQVKRMSGSALPTDSTKEYSYGRRDSH